MSLHAPTTQTSPFFRLPAELRNKIYTLALSDDMQEKQHIVHHNFTTLLRTSSQTHHGAGTLYLSSVEFVYFILDDLYKFLAAISAPYRQAIRKLEYNGLSSATWGEKYLLLVLEHHYDALVASSFGGDLRDDLEMRMFLHSEGSGARLVTYRRDGGA